MARTPGKKLKVPSRNIIAICYDFDKTLSPHNMQEDTIFKEYGIDADRFWNEVGLAIKNEGYDKILCYLNKLIFDTEFRKKPLTEERLAAMAQDVRYCPGVKGFIKAAMLAIMALDNASRPGLLAWLYAKEKPFFPKFPNTKGRSIACAAPKTVLNGAGSWFQSNR